MRNNFMMLINWYRAKKAELKVKAMFWGTIAGIIDNQKSIITMIQTLFNELKNVPAEDLQSELVSKIAELVHKDNKNNANEE